jgi:hypothetical protein
MELMGQTRFGVIKRHLHVFPPDQPNETLPGRTLGWMDFRINFADVLSAIASPPPTLPWMNV